ncbi:MAG: transcription antitermination factor NusB [bacterium]
MKKVQITTLMISSRRKARELALRALYAQEMSNNSVSVIIEEMIRGRGDQESLKNFAAKLVEISCLNKERIDGMITETARNWEFGRIAVLDKMIMRIAISEFLYFEDIPPKVSIDEAIEIAKKYSTEASGQFINGILDAVLIDLKEQNLLKKSGRGLSEN